MNVATTNLAFENQEAFRAVMEAMARPGEIKTVNRVGAPSPLEPATAALVQSLADYETPIWLDAKLDVLTVKEWIRFHTGAPIVEDKQAAVFALVANSIDMPDITQFALGSEEYPDRSTTLILQVARFRDETIHISGPGIKGRRTFAAEPLPDDFAARFAANHELFPRGVDLILVASDEIIALPRSVRILKGL
jgi:alpha-D-ribose 1-methylphosphonate 5-triphosphate synthase subunit PhnH